MIHCVGAQALDVVADRLIGDLPEVMTMFATNGTEAITLAEERGPSGSAVRRRNRRIEEGREQGCAEGRAEENPRSSEPDEPSILSPIDAGPRRPRTELDRDCECLAYQAIV